MLLWHLVGAGCDSDIMKRPFGWKDAFCDMQAALRYASQEEMPHPPMKSLKAPSPPSIARHTNNQNIVSFFQHGRSDTLLLRSIIGLSRRFLFHRPCALTIEDRNHEQEKKTLCLDI